MTATATLARLERGDQAAHAAGQGFANGHFLGMLLGLLRTIFELACGTRHHTLAAAMRRHGEYGSGQHGSHRQQAANKVERRGEIRQGLTRPGKGDIRILLLAQIDEQHRRIVLHIAFRLNAFRVAGHGMPHVGILEVDAIRVALRRIGALRARGTGLLRTKRLPGIKPSQAHIPFAGQPPRSVLGGSLGHADLSRSARQHLHRHIAVHQTGNAGIRHDITATGNLRLRRNRTAGLPFGGVHDAKSDGRDGEQAENRRHYTTHQHRMTACFSLSVWLVIHGFDLGFVCPL